MKGLFIAFEGIDGAGKSDGIKFAHRWLHDAQVNCTRTREPGGTPLAEKLREMVLWGNKGMEEDFPDWAEALMYIASRVTHTTNMIVPALESGVTVLTDRYCDSTFAHQGGGRGLDIEHLKQVHLFANGPLRPDVTFLFDGNPEIFKARMLAEGRDPDRLESQPIEFQHRSRQVHLDLYNEDPSRYVIIDAEQPPEHVQAQMIEGLMTIVNRIRARPVA